MLRSFLFMVSTRYIISAALGSFLAAVAFWLSVTMGESHVMRYQAHINVGEIPPEVALSATLPEDIDLTVQGTGWQLLFLSIGSPLTIELTGDRLRNDKLVLNQRMINELMKLPQGITVTRVIPDTLYIKTDHHIKKKIPVRLNAAPFVFRDHYGLTNSIRIEPDSIVISGAAGVVNQIGSWPTEFLQYPELSEPVEEEIALADSLLGVVRLSKNKVKINIPVEELADVMFEQVRIVVLNVPAKKEVLLANSTVDIFVRGGVSTLSMLTANDFFGAIDYKTIIQDTTDSVIPVIQLPENVTLLRMSPQRIRYTIRK